MARKRIVRLPRKVSRFWFLRLAAGIKHAILISGGTGRSLRGTVALFALAGVWAVGASAYPAGPPSQPASEEADADMPIYMMRRVVILSVPSAQRDDAPVQKRIAAERAKVEQRRHRKRKRLFASEPVGKPVRRRPIIFPPPAAHKSKEAKDLDVVPLDQRAAIAQGLLADALADRLLDRLKVATVPEAEVRAALAELHLTPQTAVSRAGALQICNRLQAQAVLAPTVTAVVLRDGVTRDCVVRATIRIPGVQYTGTPSINSAEVATPARATREPRLPSQLMVSGSARVDRVLFGSQYVQPQSAAIRLAVQQTASLAIHTLITGHVAPFMSPTTRLAIAPVLSPRQADRMLFTPQGRRVMRNAVQELPQDVSDRFHPQLLPLLPDQILTPDQISGRHDGAKDDDIPSRLGRSLWVSPDTPDVKQAQALARRLRVNYILTAHITDIELEEGPPLSEAPAIEPADLSKPRTRVARSLLDDRKPSADREREAKAEAVGALIRASDGVILWRAHAVATMSARLTGGTDPTTWSSEQRIAADAARFALVDLERQLMHYRATFEK